MKTLYAFLLSSLLGITMVAQEPGQHGIQTSDLDRKADPCVDFYEYANGAWRAANPIPAFMERWGRRWAAGENNKQNLKVILEDLGKRHDWPKSSIEQQITDHYNSCMDEARINQLGLTPIQPMLSEIDAMKTRGDVGRMIGRFHDLDIRVPFGIYGGSDYHEPTQIIAYVFAGGLGLPDRDYYLKPDQRFKEAREKYLAHVAAMFKLAGASDAQAKASAATVMRMETALAQASLDNVQLRDPHATDHKVAYRELKSMTPHFDWDGYYKSAKLPTVALNVDQPKFMAEVDRQLAKEPLGDWKTYLKWHLLNSAAESLAAPFAEEDFSFYGRYLNGATEMKPRWKRCVESTDRLLGEALGQKYVERFFPPQAKARAQELVKNVLLAMKDTINELQWMGPETKKKALEKLAGIDTKIGYPDKWKDYRSVTIVPGSFWANVVAGRKYVIDDERATIGKPLDRNRWFMTPPTSDAYYSPLHNEIAFPAGILQPPAFDVNATDAVNYGGIGVVIGHEISHGFDDTGAQFDGHGRLNNWWTEDDQKRFQQRTGCVVEQFENYYIEPNIHHIGKLVLGESIGDLAGVKIAYLAFQKAQQEHPTPTVDGFTPDQQFFISWGQFRGDSIRPEAQRVQVQSDPHPVAKFRVIGPLSNFQPFQKAFACKEGAPMVRPEGKRCEVW